MKQRYMVVYEKGKRNYSGFAPDIPGCISTGKTLEEMREMMMEAIEFHLEGMAEDGEPMPEAVTQSIKIPLLDEEPNSTTYVVEWVNVTLPKTKRKLRRNMHEAIPA